MQEQAYGSYPDVRLKCHNPVRNHGKKFMSGRGKTLTAEELTCLKSDKKWTGSGQLNNNLSQITYNVFSCNLFLIGFKINAYNWAKVAVSLKIFSKSSNLTKIIFRM